MRVRIAPDEAEPAANNGDIFARAPTMGGTILGAKIVLFLLGISISRQRVKCKSHAAKCAATYFLPGCHRLFQMKGRVALEKDPMAAPARGTAAAAGRRRSFRLADRQLFGSLWERL